jgi:hypothetical protein
MPSVLKGVSQHRLMPPRLTQLLLRSLVLLMHHLEITLILVDRLLDTSSCSIACLLTGKLLYSDRSLDLPLRLSYTLSQPLASNRNTRIASAAILASRSIPRRLSSVTMRRLYALFKVTQIASKQSFATLISTKCSFARR